MNHRVSISQALKLFGLDPASISASQVKSAFRKLAQKHHPDKYLNFKDKLDAQEKFVFVQGARELLLDALSSGALPNEDLSSDVPPHKSQKQNEEKDVSPEGTGGTGDPSILSNRPSFFNSLHPTLGSLFACLLLPGIIFMMMGLALYVWALSIAVLPVYLLGGEKYLQRVKSRLMRYWGFWRSFFVMPFMLLFGVSAALMLGNGSQVPTIAILVSCGITISWFFVEEVYCWYRYRQNKVGLELARLYHPE